jgi:NADH dehydrogenase
MPSADSNPGTSPTRPTVVIIGGGFAGLHAARGLKRAPVNVILIDRTNHHLFQPLLYQVAMASLAPSDITAPIRWLLRRQQNTRVLLGNVSSIDVNRKTVHVDGEIGDVRYDYLVIASGARHAYFGHDEWAGMAPGLKTLDDALEIRRRFLMAFEQAELTTDEAERAGLLTFVVVGGGPTGVELAGMFPDVARALKDDFRNFDTTKLRVVLVEGGERILPSFPPALSDHARRDLQSLGVDVRTGSRVTRIESGGVWIGDEFIRARTTFWAAGNKASSLGQYLGVALDQAGRVPVAADLTVEQHPDISVVGDLAACRRENGGLVPGVSPGRHSNGKARRAEHSSSSAWRTADAFSVLQQG